MFAFGNPMILYVSTMWLGCRSGIMHWLWLRSGIIKFNWLYLQQQTTVAICVETLLAGCSYSCRSNKCRFLTAMAKFKLSPLHKRDRGERNRIFKRVKDRNAKQHRVHVRYQTLSAMVRKEESYRSSSSASSSLLVKQEVKEEPSSASSSLVKQEVKEEPYSSWYGSSASSSLVKQEVKEEPSEVKAELKKKKKKKAAANARRRKSKSSRHR